MSLIRWRNKQCECEPTEASPLVGLRNEMDRLLDRFVREPLASLEDQWPRGTEGRLSPAIDVSESATDITVRAELPGVEPSELDVSVSGNRLTIAGEKKETAEHSGRDYFQQETRYGAFRRSITLPEEIDPEKVEASFDSGVLTLTLPKHQDSPPKRIDIKVGGE